MKIVLSKSVYKQLDRLPKKVFESIFEHLNELNKGSPNLDIKKLYKKETYRLRIGDNRAIFSINKTKHFIEIHKILHRKDVFKKK